MKKSKKIVKSFGHAFRGLRDAFMGEQNFRIMVYGVCASLIVLWIKPIPEAYKISLIFSGALMLIVELINTALEKEMDVVLPASLDEIRVIKDIMAGAALIASVCWFAILVLGVLAI